LGWWELFLKEEKVISDIIAKGLWQYTPGTTVDVGGGGRLEEFNELLHASLFPELDDTKWEFGRKSELYEVRTRHLSMEPVDPRSSSEIWRRSKAHLWLQSKYPGQLGSDFEVTLTGTPDRTGNGQSLTNSTAKDQRKNTTPQFESDIQNDGLVDLSGSASAATFQLPISALLLAFAEVAMVYRFFSVRLFLYSSCSGVHPALTAAQL
jgi:hypothetical protein